MHCLAPGIYSRYTKEELKKIFEELDLVIVDLDECIFPGITKVALYRNICLLLVCHRQLKDYMLLGRLFVGAIIMTLMRLAQRLYPGINNRHLILYFAKVIKPIPVPYLKEAARLIPDKSYVGARQTLEILSKNARVGIISQGLDIVLNEYIEQFTDTQGGIIDFWDGNILGDLVADRKQRIEASFIFNRYDKEIRAKRRIAQFGAKRMMVIGHNIDDLEMMRIARERKGIVVGFNPTRKVRKLCDIVIIAKNWAGFRQFLAISLDERRML